MQPPLPFAMAFANPALLWGVGAASLPIIIHLLNRRKFREEPWAAMRFLLAAIRKNQRRIRVEQWILLAIRTLIVLFVVLAMAKPFLESLGALPLLPGQRTHWVLVLDGSLSMDYRTADISRFDQAKSVASRLVKDARQGDALSVILMADPPRAVIGAPAFNAEAVRKEIEGLTLPHGGTDLAATFHKIDEVLDSSTINRKEVVFLTDLQRASWRRPGEGADESLKRELSKIEARHARSLVIDLGATGGENRAVTDLRLDPPVVTVNAPIIVRSTVTNFGRSAAPNVQVRLILDDQVADERLIDIPAGENVALAFNAHLASPGDHFVSVTINDDHLPLDNTRRLAVPVREALNVLLVDGDPKAERFRSETDFLAEALAPEDPSAATATTTVQAAPIRTEVVSESQLSRRELTPFDVVVLCNIAQFTESEATSLDSFVKQGGGLVVFGGDRVQPDNYNRLLYAGGKGLLPAAIGPVVGDPARNEAPFLFDALGFRHPIVGDYAGQPPGVAASLTNVKTFQFHKLSLAKDTTARVALAFAGTDNAPAVVESSRSRGTVVQVATSADRDWTSWPLHQSYPPVMEQMLLTAASGRFADRNVRVGQPLTGAFPASGVGTTATITRPGGSSAKVKLTADGDLGRLQFVDTDRAGPYQVAIGPPLNVRAAYAANPDPIESDPAKLDQAALKNAVPGWKFDYDNDWRGLEKNASSVGQRGELHRPLLWAVLILLIVESILAWRFGHHASPARR